MSKTKKRVIAAGLIAICGYAGYRIYQHTVSLREKNQKAADSHAESESEEVRQEEYRYLAIGNSITRHGYADYWWDDDRGMAASSDNKDYVHLVSDYLKNVHGNVTTDSVNFFMWEINHNDRAEFYTVIDPYLNDSLNLVTVQLGENASNLDTWESDWVALLNHIKEKAPNADIVVIGDFWSNNNRDELKEKAALACQVKFVSLDGLKDNPEYYAGTGTVVEGKDSVETHVIEHNGVANHPGDKGMRAIADRIIAVL